MDDEMINVDKEHRWVVDAGGDEPFVFRTPRESMTVFEIAVLHMLEAINFNLALISEHLEKDEQP